MIVAIAGLHAYCVPIDKALKHHGLEVANEFDIARHNAQSAAESPATLDDYSEFLGKPTWNQAPDR
ncbi:hypothetical protein [Devosia sediminis]|uniref:Uncharacterized protein n=1 Tax=Devosia sediminis TaxID=2798801 RepID=A0A934IXS6_9HYPH|nr:hypothetical protein [Devosia sediminis]MBJ3786352.1 hypothetical protein [Devosia sediminis]